MTTRWCHRGLFFLKKKKNNSRLLQCIELNVIIKQLLLRHMTSRRCACAVTGTVTLSGEKMRLEASQRTMAAELQIHTENKVMRIVC